MVSYPVESWIWYSIVVFFVVTRFTSRVLILGSPKRLQVDDYIMAVVTVRPF